MRVRGCGAPELHVRRCACIFARDPTYRYVALRGKVNIGLNSEHDYCDLRKVIDEGRVAVQQHINIARGAYQGLTKPIVSDSSKPSKKRRGGGTPAAPA